MPISLPDDTSKRLRLSIQRFFADELDQSIGDLKAATVLDYVLKEIAPSVYNQAIADASEYLTARVADLEGACFEKEFTYWKR